MGTKRVLGEGNPNKPALSADIIVMMENAKLFQFAGLS
jgi:hypothetical protein